MKNKICLVILICLLLLFTVSCKKENSGGAPGGQENSSEVSIENLVQEEETEQKVFTFTLQEIKPIEDNPHFLPVDISSNFGLHILSVERPQMDENTNPNDVISALLGSPNQVADINSKDLLDHIYLETFDQQIVKTVFEEDGYLRAFIQKTDNASQENGEDLRGDLYLDAVNYYAIEAGGMNDSSCCAVLIKYRNSGVILEEIGISNSNIGTRLGKLDVDNMNHIH